MTSESVVDVVSILEQAQRTRTPCPPVRGMLRGPDVGGDGDDLEADIERAYDVQRTLVAHRVALGARVVGRKVGLTNPKVQAQLGVDRPDFGVLLDDMQRRQDEPVDVNTLLQPKIEAEIAFVLGADLDGDDLDEAAVVAATAHVVAALEIVDSRVAGWDISILDTVADNGSSALFVLGSRPVALDGVNLAELTMSLTKDGEVVSQGRGADCLGHPLTAVLWLARTARRHGDPLRKGDVILSGALGPMVAIEAGNRFVASIDVLGPVTASFSGSRG